MPTIASPSPRVPFMGTEHMIASGHQLATLAGFRILEDGGNAVDAGIAAGIAINVTLPQLTSFGGVAPIILYLADREELVTIDGLGRWPKAANLEDYKKKYNGIMPTGIPRSVVPAACDAWLTALERYGTMTFEQVVAPSLELAENGFPASYNLTRALENRKEYGECISQSSSTAAIFMPNEKPVQPGQMIVQKELARVFLDMVEVERANAYKGRNQAIRAARDFFYKGDVAEKMVSFCQQQGGLLSKEDFAQFSVAVESPKVGTYKDYTVYTCGPWCQGPSLIEALNILEGFDLKAMEHNSARYIHSLVEAMKLTFADRHAYYGDPDFVDVPIAGLLSKDYAAERRDAIDLNRAWPEMPPAGDPWPYEGKARAQRPVPATPRSGPVEPDTSYTCVVDRWGNAFSATPSDSFGSSPVVPGLGMIISPRGSQTWLEPEHPCCVAPWKRPRLTPNPAIAFKNGRLFMPFGTPGGDMQVQAMLQMFLGIVEFGLNPQQATEEPRFRSDSFPNSVWPHPYYPGQLTMEGHIDKEVTERLAKLGHRIAWWEDSVATNGDLCGIVVDKERGILIGGADPRWDSYVLGW